MNGKIAVIATKPVEKELCKILAEKGKFCEEVSGIGKSRSEDILRKYDNIVLPFPSRRENIPFLIEGVFLSDLVNSNQKIIGGMISEEIKKDLQQAGISYVDYFENEAYVLKNAHLTSQGAVKLFLDNIKDSIIEKKVLISGFGRIGKLLGFAFKSMGAKVFVTARRNETIVDAKTLGFDVIKILQLSSAVFYFDYIFNTVPAVIYGDNDVKHIRDDTVYFELASAPYGALKTDFEKYGKNYISAGGLPGKFYPVAVAKNISEFMLSEVNL